MRYVDGFVIVIPTKNLKAYKKMAVEGGDTWMKHGALEYMECVADDMKSIEAMGGLPFPKMVSAKKGETVIFSFIIYKNKKHRDAVNKKVHKEFEKAYENQKDFKMPFDPKRVAFGGFEAIVDR
jgi:uncharacterized protein YbaA (DUF1428 family)